MVNRDDKEEWLEVLGCGVIHPQIMKNCGLEGQVGWALGLGLDRLAMKLFDIRDIRTLWSNDENVSCQWLAPTALDMDLKGSGDVKDFKFVNPCKLSPISERLSFWIPSSSTGELGFNENSFYGMVRRITNDQVLEVDRVDTFTHLKTGRIAHGYLIKFLPPDSKMNNGADFKALTVGYLKLIAVEANVEFGLVQK